MTRRWWAVVTLVVGCVAPERATSQTGRIARDRVLADLTYLASDELQGRATGTEGNRLARQYIADAFARAGLQPFRSSFSHTFPLGNADDGNGTNVLAYVPGAADPERFIVITAHYDHLGPGNGEIFNGADDNASGTAALLAFARYLVDHPPHHSIILAAFDAEEGGLRGARAFVASPPVPLERIGLNVNLDMISHSDSLLFAVGTHHYPFLRPRLQRVTPRPPVVLRFGHDRPSLGADDWTAASDHAPFHQAGVPFVYFGVEDHPDYHKVTDHVETINEDFYLAALESILDAVLILDSELDAVWVESGRGGG